MTPTGTTEESRVRALVERRARAIREGDLEGMTEVLAEDVRLFDALPPLRYVGRETARERAEAWLSGYDGAVGYEIRELEVVADGEVAFAHYLYRVTGALKDGGKVDMWVRATVGLRRLDGEWRVTHEHHSVPFHGETGRAALDLDP